MLAHAYISVPCEVTKIIKEFKDVPLESFVFKAASKAFKDTVNKNKLSISRVHAIEKRSVVENVHELRVG